MLQQGRFVADIVYFYGEDNNITALFGSELPDIPEGYNYDFVNSDAIVNLLTVKNGLICTPGGMTYRLLALDSNSVYMSLPVLRKIEQLVKSGAIVTGPRPISSPSLSDDMNEFRKRVESLWPADGEVNSFGKGRVYTGRPLKDVMEMIEPVTDFEYSKPEGDTRLMFVHRKSGDVDFYWVNNRNNRIEDLDASFRVTGREAEIWHPETGKIELVSYSTGKATTQVPFHLQPNDAFFVVFRNKTGEKSRMVPQLKETQVKIVEGPWEVSFQPGRGAPERITIDSLIPWNESPDSRIKYFSGTGTYLKNIQAPAEWFNQGGQLWLDLGNVKNLAEVYINGKSAGLLWKSPFRIDVTDYLKEGDNRLEIKVTNLWVNRLIGDQQPDAGGKDYLYDTKFLPG